MGIARDIAAIEGAWETFTHVGANSGGSWFVAMLVYSERFWNHINDLSLPVKLSSLKMNKITQSTSEPCFKISIE